MTTPRIPRRRLAGFSIVELVIAMLVGAILLRLAAPSFANWIANQRVRSTAEALLHGLNVARSEALRRNARVLFTMPGANGGESAWQVCQVVQGGLQVAQGGELFHGLRLHLYEISAWAFSWQYHPKKIFA